MESPSLSPTRVRSPQDRDATPDPRATEHPEAHRTTTFAVAASNLATAAQALAAAASALAAAGDSFRLLDGLGLDRCVAGCTGSRQYVNPPRRPVPKMPAMGDEWLQQPYIFARPAQKDMQEDNETFIEISETPGECFSEQVIKQGSNSEV
jgi:hypothetical protein